MTKCATALTVLLAVTALAIVACNSATSSSEEDATPTPTLAPTPSPTPTLSPYTGYLIHEVPPCTPVPGSDVDPCEPGTSLLGSVATQPGGSSTDVGASIVLTPGGLDARYQLALGNTLIAHLVVRATYLPGSIRCKATDGLRPPPQWRTALPLNDIGTIKCYTNVRTNEYIMGSGPSVLTVVAFREVYGHNYHGSLEPDKENETEQEYIERLRLFHEQRLGGGADNIEGREAMLFLGPSNDIGVEAWQVMHQWRLEQQDDDAVVAVHPGRDDWRRFSPDEYQQYRSQLEMELPAFKQSMIDAHQARVAANGGRTRPDPTFPMLVSDANQLRQYYTEVGAYDDPDDPPAQPPSVPACASGTAVTSPSTNRGLVYDCEALLAGKDELRGMAALNWSVDTVITSWDGVTTSGTPSRVTEVELSDESLSGSIPPELGTLFELTTLDLSTNSLTGEIPTELGWLSNLEELRLSGNQLTGCVPVVLKDVATNDLNLLNLLYCAPPAPESLTVTPGETSVALSWDTVSNASKYRVEYRTSSVGDWTVDDEAITGPSHTVDGLVCESYYRFSVSTYGSGTVYAAAWGEPSEVLVAETGECVPP